MSHCSPVCGKHIVAYADKEDVTPCPVCGLQVAKEEIVALRAELATERAKVERLFMAIISVLPETPYHPDLEPEWVYLSKLVDEMAGKRESAL